MVIWTLFWLRAKTPCNQEKSTSPVSPYKQSLSGFLGKKYTFKFNTNLKPFFLSSSGYCKDVFLSLSLATQWSKQKS